MIVFFPVTFLSGVSQFLFTALALAVVLSLAASYIVAMTVVPLYCAKLMKRHEVDEEIHEDKVSAFGRIVEKFNFYFERMLGKYDRTLALSVARPVATVVGLMGVFLLSLALYPLLGVSFFPRTDPGQFVINLKAPPGLRIELTEKYVARIEDEIRTIVPPDEMGMIVSNIGITPDFSAMYTSNSVHSSQPERGPQGWQLRVHGPRAEAPSPGYSRTQYVFPVRWIGRCGTQLWSACSRGCAGKRLKSGKDL
jgi:multidrug efflux pump subunit AcrB